MRNNPRSPKGSSISYLYFPTLGYASMIIFESSMLIKSNFFSCLFRSLDDFINGTIFGDEFINLGF